MEMCVKVQLLSVTGFSDSRMGNIWGGHPKRLLVSKARQCQDRTSWKVVMEVRLEHLLLCLFLCSSLTLVFRRVPLKLFLGRQCENHPPCCLALGLVTQVAL